MPYLDIGAFRLATVGSERLGRRPTLLVRVGGDRQLGIAALEGTGAIGELTDALARELAAA